MSSGIIKAFARLVEFGKKNLNDISEKLLDDVKAQIIEDGYTINDDGTVTPNG